MKFVGKFPSIVCYLNVEHVNFVDEENAGDQLGDALVNVLVDDLKEIKRKTLTNML